MIEAKQKQQTASKELMKQYPASAVLDRDTTVFFLIPQ
jgi:hypothetical protein